MSRAEETKRAAILEELGRKQASIMAIALCEIQELTGKALKEALKIKSSKE